MGYFSSFLVCHVYFRHRLPTTGFSILDVIFRMGLYSVIIGWAVAVAYSRFFYFYILHRQPRTDILHDSLYLDYHTPHQVFWGIGIGIAFGTFFYVITELIPARRPGSFLGRIRAFLINNPVSTWLRIRDGWLIWPDGGHEEEWKRWRADLDRRRLTANKRRS
jgi:dolichyldiphosphatase